MIGFSWRNYLNILVPVVCNKCIILRARGALFLRRYEKGFKTVSINVEQSVNIKSHSKNLPPIMLNTFLKLPIHIYKYVYVYLGAKIFLLNI